MHSQPLLKFKDDVAFLAPEGLEAVKALPGLICPVIFIGDGRSGKSYLASRLLGLEGAFVSSDSADPVTEGIDMVAVPTSTVVEACGDLPSGAVASQGEYVLILDCEGGNNAMAAIRTLVNVFGILLGTEVVFVANGMATEQALQNLGTSLAARSLVRLDGSSRLPEQRLIFVVNKNTLRYEASALEKILDQKYDDPGRQELRDTVRAAFPERDFFAVPLIGMPAFEESIQALRAKLVEHRRPLTLGGTAVQGQQLCGLLELVVTEIRRSSEVSFPSMKRFVIFEGFLAPLTRRLVEEMEAALPRLDDYDHSLESRDPRSAVLASFDEAAAHLAHEAALLEEARGSLQKLIDGHWKEVLRANEALGEQVVKIAHEEREVLASSRKRTLGGGGLLKRLVVTEKTMSVESRAVVHRKRGGDPECSDWTCTQGTVTRWEESAFDSLRTLPVLKGPLWKQSPSFLRTMLRFMNGHNQERVCVVKDGHFLWWKPDALESRAEAQGCINFFVHRAEVVPDKNYPTVFSIRPTDESGWAQANVSFTGGTSRAFHFDAEAGEVSRDEWVRAIARHIEFANLARRQIGDAQVMEQVRVYRPKYADVEPSQ